MQSISARTSDLIEIEITYRMGKISLCNIAYTLNYLSQINYAFYAYLLNYAFASIQICFESVENMNNKLRITAV